MKQHHFATELASRREARGLTLRAMSEALERETGLVIDPSGLKRLESGDREPRLFEALGIAKFFHTDVQDMAEPSGVAQAIADLRGAISRCEADAQHVAESERDLDASKAALSAVLANLNGNSEDLYRNADFTSPPYKELVALLGSAAKWINES